MAVPPILDRVGDIETAYDDRRDGRKVTRQLVQDSQYERANQGPGGEAILAPPREGHLASTSR